MTKQTYKEGMRWVEALNVSVWMNILLTFSWYGCYKMKSKPIDSTQSSMMKMDSVESVAEKGSTAEIQKNEVHRRRQLSLLRLE